VLAYSLVGDPASFLQGVSLAIQWLDENRVDACLVIGAEEANWSWQGPPVTNTDGTNVTLEITNTPDPHLFFYGVKVRPAP